MESKNERLGTKIESKSERLDTKIEYKHDGLDEKIEYKYKMLGERVDDLDAKVFAMTCFTTSFATVKVLSFLQLVSSIVRFASAVSLAGVNLQDLPIPSCGQTSGMAKPGSNTDSYTVLSCASSE